MCRSLKTRNAIAIPERVEILAQKMAGNSRFEPNRYAGFEGPFTARKPEADDHTLELLLRAESGLGWCSRGAVGKLPRSLRSGGFQCLLLFRHSRARLRSPRSGWRSTAGIAVIRIACHSPIPRIVDGEIARSSSTDAPRSSLPDPQMEQGASITV